MTGLSPQQRAAARSRLAAEREQTTTRLAALQRDLESIIASTASDRQHVAALLASAKEQLAAIARAERRLDDGSYGRCERCGQEIGAERMAARPAAATCVTCAAARR